MRKDAMFDTAVAAVMRDRPPYRLHAFSLRDLGINE